jgi:hypothetical protein
MIKTDGSSCNNFMKAVSNGCEEMEYTLVEHTFCQGLSKKATSDGFERVCGGKL